MKHNNRYGHYSRNPYLSKDWHRFFSVLPRKVEGKWVVLKWIERDVSVMHSSEWSGYDYIETNYRLKRREF